MIYRLAQWGRLPDPVIRALVRRALLGRLRSVVDAAGDSAAARFLGLPEADPGVELWRPNELPLWDRTADAAGQVLGRPRLTAAALWKTRGDDLERAEDETLGLVSQRAALEPDQDILIVSRHGLAVASHVARSLPTARVVAWAPTAAPARQPEPDARGQDAATIDIRAGVLGETLRAERFDRIICLESLPPNVPAGASLEALVLLLRPGGKLFLQLACHRRYAYRPGVRERRWLGLAVDRLVPATDLVPRLARGAALEGHWEHSGEHYERTLRVWRLRLETQRERLLHDLAADAVDRPQLTFASWRLALLARETMFGLRGGQEWWTSHYLLSAPR